MKDQYSQIIDRMADYFASTARTPMHGRVFGYLLVHPTEACSFKDICAALDVSKSAVSNTIAALIEGGLVRVARKDGKRKRLFTVNASGWLERSKQEMRGAARFNDILRHCRSLNASAEGSSVAMVSELDTMINFHEGYLRQIEDFITTWESSRATSVNTM